MPFFAIAKDSNIFIVLQFITIDIGLVFQYNYFECADMAIFPAKRKPWAECKKKWKNVCACVRINKKS